MPTSKPIDTTPPVDFEPTLLDFKCLITDIRDEVEDNRESIIFDCAELEIIEAKEPFNLPVAQVKVRYLRMPYSQWAIMAESIEKCGFKGEINGLINKRVHFRFAPALMSLPRQLKDEVGNVIGRGEGYENRQGRAMQIVEIEGSENTSNILRDKLLAMADNRNATAFKAEFMSDMSLQGYTGYQDVANQVMQNQFLDMMVGSNNLTLDETGVYHKVG